ncbi:MAG: 50S ribosomal protein L15 [Bullifex sp.]
MGQINAPYGANTKKTIVGRGASSKGRACGRGHDGQNSRSGGGVRLGFEGGQMPLYRRIARRGFSNCPFKVTYEVVSLSTISDKYADGETVSLETLKAKGIVKGNGVQVKVLSNGTLTKKVAFEGVCMSQSAKSAAEAAGCSVK